jgi:protein SCO1/2
MHTSSSRSTPLPCLDRVGSVGVLWVVVSLVSLLTFSACTNSSETGDDFPIYQNLSESPVRLVNQNAEAVQFPKAYRGNVLVIGAIYTQCPDICAQVTANMVDVREKLDDTDNVRFVTVTFDPRRDTPARMNSYRDAFRIGDAPWPFLSGSQAAIDSLMNQLEIKTQISSGDTTGTYFIDHTDQITLVDSLGRIRYRYHGSGTPPEIIAEDINKLRGLHSGESAAPGRALSTILP